MPGGRLSQRSDRNRDQQVPRLPARSTADDQSGRGLRRRADRSGGANRHRGRRHQHPAAGVRGSRRREQSGTPDVPLPGRWRLSVGRAAMRTSERCRTTGSAVRGLRVRPGPRADTRRKSRGARAGGRAQDRRHRVPALNRVQRVRPLRSPLRLPSGGDARVDPESRHHGRVRGRGKGLRRSARGDSGATRAAVGARRRTVHGTQCTRRGGGCAQGARERIRDVHSRRVARGERGRRPRRGAAEVLRVARRHQPELWADG